MEPIRIRSCTNDIEACHREDQYAREKLDDVVRQNGGKPADRSLTPNGVGYAAAKAEWQATRGGARMAKKAARAAAITAGVESVVQIAEKLVHKGIVTFAHASQSASKLVHGVEALGFVALVFEGVKLVTEMHEGAVSDAREQAQREMDGINRDAMRAFIFSGTGDVLPAKYRAYIARAISKDGVRVAMKMVTHASVDNGRYEAEKQVMRAMAKHGMDEANRLSLSTRADLERALKSDAGFREKFESSTAFRLGVGAVLFERGVR